MHGAECRRNDKTGVRAKHQRSRPSLKFARSGTLASLKPDVFMIDTREIRIGRQSELETTGMQSACRAPALWRHRRHNCKCPFQGCQVHGRVTCNLQQLSFSLDLHPGHLW